MQFDDVILGRRSIRGYKPDPVPRALIEEIIGLAMRAPSSMYTQPWNFYVITGEPLDRMERNGILVTPPAPGLLRGVLRDELIATGRAIEGELTVADLTQEFYIGNALRGLMIARMVAPGGAAR